MLKVISPSDRYGLNREEAATYIGIKPTLFDTLVADGRMPKPRCINSRRVWSRIELEKAFALLPVDGQHDEENPWLGVA